MKRKLLTQNPVLRCSILFLVCLLLAGLIILIYPLPPIKGLVCNTAIRNCQSDLITYQPQAENAISFLAPDSQMVKLAKYVVLREDPYLLRPNITKRILGISPRFLVSGNGGASTMPQQFLKNISDNRKFLADPLERTIYSKLGEMVGAVILSLRYSPEEILQMHLNNAAFITGNFTGFIAAAESCFEPSFNQLNDAELYLMARSLRGPASGGFDFRIISTMPRDSLYNLIEESFRKSMIANGRGTEEELQMILRMPIRFNKSDKHLAGNDYALNTVKYIIPDSLKEEGMQYVSNLETDKVKAVNDGFEQYAIEKRDVLKLGDFVLDAIACIVDMRTGEVIGINTVPLSGIMRDTSFSVRPRIFENVIGGSTWKPVVIANGIDAGYLNANTLLLDQYQGRVHNHNDVYRGLLSLRDLIKYSSNTGLDNYGRKTELVNLTELKLLQLYGNTLKPLPTDGNASQYLLGQSREISIIQLAQLYRAILTNGVVYSSNIYQTVLSSTHYPFDTLYTNKTQPQRIFSPSVAPAMRYILTSPFEPGGTLNACSKLIKDFEPGRYFGKTGTSSGYEQGTTIIANDRFLVAVQLQYVNLKNRRGIMIIPGRSGGASAGKIASFIFNHLN